MKPGEILGVIIVLGLICFAVFTVIAAIFCLWQGYRLPGAALRAEYQEAGGKFFLISLATTVVTFFLAEILKEKYPAEPDSPLEDLRTRTEALLRTYVEPRESPQIVSSTPDCDHEPWISVRAAFCGRCGVVINNDETRMRVVRDTLELSPRKDGGTKFKKPRPWWLEEKDELSGD